MTLGSGRLTMVVGSLLLAGGAFGADLVEPWDPQRTNLELSVAGVDAGGLATLVGTGVTDRVSVGWCAGRDGDGLRDTGFVAIVHQPLGRGGDLDVWSEVGLSSAGGGDGDKRFGGGLEWSGPWSALVPYVRLTGAAGDPGTAWGGLVGVMRPVGERLGLHLELSLDDAGDEGSTRRLALGPNVLVHPRVEVLPELSWERAPDGRSELGFAWTVVFDLPRAIPFLGSRPGAGDP